MVQHALSCDEIYSRSHGKCNSDLFTRFFEICEVDGSKCNGNLIRLFINYSYTRTKRLSYNYMKIYDYYIRSQL